MCASSPNGAVRISRHRSLPGSYVAVRPVAASRTSNLLPVQTPSGPVEANGAGARRLHSPGSSPLPPAITGDGETRLGPVASTVADEPPASSDGATRGPSLGVAGVGRHAAAGEGDGTISAEARGALTKPVAARTIRAGSQGGPSARRERPRSRTRPCSPGMRRHSTGQTRTRPRPGFVTAAPPRGLRASRDHHQWNTSRFQYSTAHRTFAK